MRAMEIEVRLSDLDQAVFISHFPINKWQFKFNDKVFCYCCSVAKLSLSLCDPMDCSTPGFSVLHYLLEFVQTHVHWVSDAIQPSVVPFSSCPQSSPASGSVPVRWLFTSGGQSIRASVLASVLPMNIQGWFLVGFPCSPRDSRESSPAPQFESINSSALRLPYDPTPMTVGKTITLTTEVCW